MIWRYFMLSDYELMELQVNVLFNHDEFGGMTWINEPGTKSAPRIFLGITNQGTVERYHQALHEDVKDELTRIVAKAPWVDAPNRVNLAEIISVLSKDRLIENVYAGPAYVFPDLRGTSTQAVRITHENIGLLEHHFPDFFDDVENGQPMFAVVQNQVAVSLCCSARQTSDAAEASLHTAQNFRGKGYALEVCTAWAAEVQSQGQIAFYSTAWNNLSSQAVARKLRLRQYGVDLHFS
ncbi:GNAT family N-acetyltransferase [Bacillus sp. APMAM]|nr:GNAT family N-acetyltransferase [Bacillus sp. APMAM]RTZ53565.1 GNAT family N-acetyltransferase [Bacillus sp. SAJ1]